MSKPDFLKDIAEFHEKFGLAYDGKPRLLQPELADFRYRFMLEELKEWADHQGYHQGHSRTHGTDNHAFVANCLEGQLDAMVDLAYVMFGTVYLQGMGPHFEEAWRRVHAANMAKVRTERAEDSKRGSTFDVIKPPGWTPPTHTDLVTDHAHKEA